MAPSSAGVSDNRGTGHSVGYNLGVIALTVVMAGLACAYGLGKLVHSDAARPGSEALVSQTLLGRQLHVPAAWLRGTTASKDGFASRIDLALILPLGPAGAMAAVGVMLVPQSQVRPSVAMLDGVYLHQFTTGELSGPPGLIGKPLSAAEGYAGETVWYDPLSASPFVAKCSDAPDGRGPAQCLRSVALPNGIAAVFSFDSSVLGSWQGFDPALETALHQIGAL